MSKPHVFSFSNTSLLYEMLLLWVYFSSTYEPSVKFQVPIYPSDDIFKRSFWLPFCPYNHKMVHWIQSWFVSCNDIHVSESYWWTWWKPAFSRAEDNSGWLIIIGKIFLLLISILSPTIFIFIWLKLTSNFSSLCYYCRPSSLFLGCCYQSLSSWSYNTMYSISLSLIFYIILDWSSSTKLSYSLPLSFCRGTTESPMHHFQTQKSLCSRSQIMIPMAMRSLNSVKFLYTSSYIQ